jgi:hypothetical protein
MASYIHLLYSFRNTEEPLSSLLFIFFLHLWAVSLFSTLSLPPAQCFCLLPPGVFFDHPDLCWARVELKIHIQMRAPTEQNLHFTSMFMMIMASRYWLQWRFDIPSLHTHAQNFDLVIDEERKVDQYWIFLVSKLRLAWNAIAILLDHQDPDIQYVRIYWQSCWVPCDSHMPSIFLSPWDPFIYCLNLTNLSCAVMLLCLLLSLSFTKDSS